MHGASVVTQPVLPQVALGGSLAEGFFLAPLCGRAHCEECGTTIFEVKGGMMILRSRHHGKPHVNVFAIADIPNMLR